jgi:hypothetical protein
MYDILYGRHSGFRWCCILFYVTIWPSVLKRMGGRYGWWTDRQHRRNGVGYVSCPLCAFFKRTPVKVHHCDDVTCSHTFGGPWATHFAKGKS